MSWITRVSLKNIDEQTRRRALDAAQFCEENDRYGTFNWQEEGDFLVISGSTSRNQALKRGSYFHKKFGTFYNTEREG